MTTLHFKLEYTIRGTPISPSDRSLTFNYVATPTVRVVIRTPSLEEQAQGHKPANPFCAAFGEWSPNERVLTTFERIESNEILSPDEDATLTYPAPDGSRIRLPTLSAFPEPFRSFAAHVRKHLDGFSRQTVSVLRWRTAMLGPHNPISSRGMFWSRIGEAWHVMPADHHVVVSVGTTLRATQPIQASVEQIVNSGQDAPLHHDLFREAWEQIYDNPRSALIIGMAAAELSMKHCIARLVPDAQWLAMNVPTPPLIQLLSEYLPQLCTIYRFDGKVRPPPRNVLETLQKGVRMRNRIAHSESPAPGGDQVQEVLNAVRDLLCLVDYYCGAEWAIESLRAETREELEG